MVIGEFVDGFEPIGWFKITISVFEKQNQLKKLKKNSKWKANKIDTKNHLKLEDWGRNKGDSRSQLIQNKNFKKHTKTKAKLVYASMQKKSLKIQASPIKYKAKKVQIFAHENYRMLMRLSFYSVNSKKFHNLDYKGKDNFQSDHVTFFRSDHVSLISNLTTCHFPPV